MTSLHGKTTRRSFLAASASLAAATPLAALAADAPQPSFPIVDTHTHFYDPSRPQGVPWPGKGTSLYRTVLPAGFKKLAVPLGISGTVIVEASAWLEDNQWLLDLAAEDPYTKGICGHLTPGTEEFPSHIKRFGKNPLFRGIRVSSAGLAAGLEEATYRQHLALMADADWELDVNGRPNLLPTVAKTAKLVPNLRIVVNHLANVRNPADAPPLAEWVDGMKAASDSGEQVFCKVSAMVEATGAKELDAPSDVERYRPYLDVAWSTFGEDRLMFGSNWPVSERAADLKTLVQIVRTYFAEKGKPAEEKFFAGNAKRAYRWPDRT